MLRGIFGSKGEASHRMLEKKQCNELYDLYTSPNIIRVIKSRRKR
jgi:hypothetical protein